VNKRLYFCLLFLSLCLSLFACDKFIKKNNTLKINLYDGNELVESIEYKSGNILELPTLIKEGFDFKGWFLDEEGNNSFDSSKINDYFKEKEIALYANWNTMNELKLEIYGEIEGRIVNNPIIKWLNEFNDTTFNLIVKNRNDEILNINTSDNKYAFNDLMYNAEYQFTIKGNDSKKISVLKYKTISNLGYSFNRKIEIDPTYVSNMVIQRNEEIIINGTGPEMCLIETLFNDEEYYSISDEDGNFEAIINKKEGSFDPAIIKIGNNFEPIVLSNILIGDVYLFSGQSNMQWPIETSDYLKDDIDLLKNDKVRFFSQNVKESIEPLENVSGGKWFTFEKTNAMSFSAIATMTAAFLSDGIKDLNVPLGILTAYQGNTNIANWMGSDYYNGNCSTKYLHYNAMIYPLRNHKISGVVWYHGCNNSAAGGDYKNLLLALFDNYRNLFNNKTLDFFVIGLACYDGDSGNNYDFSYVRESQYLACLEDKNAYFISTVDDGDPTYIHPKRKRYICERVSKSIQSVIYNNFNYYSEGPSYKSHTVNGNVVTIELNNSDGLYATGNIDGMYLAGSDGKYYLASTTIQNNKLIVSSSNCSNPVYIKYGFGKSPFVNIFNKDNYSLVPFRTDIYNLNIDLLDYNSTDNYYFHPEGSLMNVSLDQTGLKIKKYNDSKTYGSIRLDKWGMVSYDASGFRIRIVGENSQAKIQIRFIEGPSYETWGYEIIDDFNGEKTFEISISDFQLLLNRADNILDTQCISYIEAMIESNKEVNLEIKELRFIEIERTLPKNFSIGNVSFNDKDVIVTLNKSIFAKEYEISILDKKDINSTPIYTSKNETTVFKIDKSLFTVNTPYYVIAKSINEIGETKAKNDLYIFYVNDGNSLIINKFDFIDQESLDSYMDSNMQVHNSLNPILMDEGIKIESNGGGWEYFIFVIESGSNRGMNKLVFDADFTNYKGQVVLEIVGTNWEIFEYTLDLAQKNKGTFEIDLASYVSKSTKLNYNGENLMWVSFNFNDSIGNGYILFDDCLLIK